MTWDQKPVILIWVGGTWWPSIYTSVADANAAGHISKQA